MIPADHPGRSKENKCDHGHKPIVLGLDRRDAQNYGYTLDIHFQPARLNTLRTQQGRGFIGPVFASPAIQAHPKYTQLLNEARPSGIVCSCYAEHPERVA